MQLNDLISAISSDGSKILLIKKKEALGSVKELASTAKGVLGCKMRDGLIILDRNTTMEIQSALHICGSNQCYLFFMLGSNVSDHILHIVDKDEEFFESKVEEKLVAFLNDYFLKKVVEKQITVKQ